MTTLHTLLVDARSGVHCVQRCDGRCVVGGDLRGYVLGDEADAIDATMDAADATDDDASGDASFGAALRARAAAWLPQLATCEVEAVTHAERVMPKDGFPAVGWARGVFGGADGGGGGDASGDGAGGDRACGGGACGGVYVCAAHSGVTLAPVLAAVAAAEIVDGVECELIDEAWRPARFAA